MWPPITSIALIGTGAIGGAVIDMLRDDPRIRIGGVIRRRAPSDKTLPRSVHRVEDLDATVSIIVEVAGTDAVRVHGPDVLQSGRDLAVLSTAAFVDDDFLRRMRTLAQACEQRLVVLAGAIGGIDFLRAANASGLTDVTYVGRKPPNAWKGTPAEDLLDLDAIESPTVFFEGTARESAALYPQNANVAATLSLAGVGFDRTAVTLIADPTIDRNVHAYAAQSNATRFRFESEGFALSSNPKTSAVTAYGVVSFLRDGAGAFTI